MFGLLKSVAFGIVVVGLGAGLEAAAVVRAGLGVLGLGIVIGFG